MTDADAVLGSGAPGHRSDRGPAIVAVGGGHGLAASLQALRRHAGSLVAVVSVADDGGSSGRLRQALPGLPAPGDVRRCLVALADPRSALGSVLEHRFEDHLLGGHALGNLLLAALAEQLGSFGAAVDAVAEQIGAVGRVLPATLGPVSLVGLRAEAASIVLGQVAVQGASGIARLQLDPQDAPSSPAVADAILAADQVVLGPGSLFTSVLAAAVVPSVRDALRATSAQRVFVANLHAEVPETEELSAADEVAAALDHGIPVDVVVADPARSCGGGGPVRCVEVPVAAADGSGHDPHLLGDALAAVLAAT